MRLKFWTNTVEHDDAHHILSLTGRRSKRHVRFRIVAFINTDTPVDQNVGGRLA